MRKSDKLNEQRLADVRGRASHDLVLGIQDLLVALGNPDGSEVEQRAWREIPSLVELARRLEAAEAGRARAAYLAEHLFLMVTPETWRASGGDDGQGHYEGDYHAAQVQAEIAYLRAAEGADE